MLNDGIYDDSDTKGRCRQKFKTGVIVAPKKTNVIQLQKSLITHPLSLVAVVVLVTVELVVHDITREPKQHQ